MSHKPAPKRREHMLMTDMVCVIVGASSLRGIGYATAERFAAHGAKLVLIDVAMDETVAGNIAGSIEAHNGCAPELAGVQCDIQHPSDCDRAIAAAVARYGTIDCLVNCAAIVKAQGMLETTEADYDRILDVNLKGTFNTCRSALHIFSEKQAGVIVNVASVAAQRGGGLIGGAHYAASKGGVISLTRTIAREFGPLGIRANVICPSMVETGMLDGNLTRYQFDAIVAGIPLQRAGRPSDIAGVCLFLASDLSAYVTGATIDVNGGSHIH